MTTEFTRTYTTTAFVTHVGIVKAPGLMIEAGPRRGAGELDYTTPYWQEHFVGYGRPHAVVAWLEDPHPPSPPLPMLGEGEAHRGVVVPESLEGGTSPCE
jgi:hypothetical protein